MDPTAGPATPEGPTEGSSMLDNYLEPRDRQLVRILLVLAVVALIFVIGGELVSAF